MTNYLAEYVSPIGCITVLTDDTYLLGISIEGQEVIPGEITPPNDRPKVMNDTFRWLDVYFDGKIPDFTPAISFVGTPFRLEVWNELTKIAYGTTVTYGSIAKSLEGKNGNRVSAQAVGGAVGHNPIPIIVPCHRVIGADGSLTGYAGGLHLKKQLLTIEKIRFQG